MSDEYKSNGFSAGEHFQFQNGDELRTRSSKSRERDLHNGNGHNGQRSSQSPNRSIVKVADGKRAKKVRFYRNGDRFFRGIVYAVSTERFRTFESLLVSLTSSPLCDKNVLPNGVRHVYSIDGMRKITDLDDLYDDESYVCASTEAFKKVEYGRNSSVWSPNTRALTDQLNASQSSDLSSEKDFIHPKLVTVIRNGSKPRKAVRILLNKKTAHSFSQVLTDITNAIKLDSGSVKKIFTISGQQVCTLQDFFLEDTVFLAYGHERTSADDFDLDEKEVRVVGAYKSSKPKERVALGSRSPNSQRRLLTSSSRSLNDVTLNLTRSAPNSPRFARKTKPKSPLSSPQKSPIRSKPPNGHVSPESQSGSSMLSPFPVPASITQKYIIGKLIGDGNFAVVKSCTEKATQKLFALKIIDKTRCRGKETMIENEVSILREVQHENIVALIEDFDTDSEMYLVMEYVKGGDLFDAISSSTTYTERDASQMLANIASALHYLHSYKICHRDVKPENLLLCERSDGSKALKLGDFGLATRLIADEPLRVVCGTPTYVAPEILKETGYGLEVDIWSTGVITYILLCGFAPFGSPSDNNDVLFKKILEGNLDFSSTYWQPISQPAKDLITKMLDVDVTSRYTAQQVLQHLWVTETDKSCATNLEISDSITLNFDRRRKGNPGIAVIASTALDKQSRFFSWRNQQPEEEVDSRLSYANGHDDDTF